MERWIDRYITLEADLAGNGDSTCGIWFEMVGEMLQIVTEIVHDIKYTPTSVRNSIDFEVENSGRDVISKFWKPQVVEIFSKRRNCSSWYDELSETWPEYTSYQVLHNFYLAL